MTDLRRGDWCAESGFLRDGKCRNPDGCTCDMLIAAREREADYRAALVDQNDLLRSAMQIAKREGVDGQVASTNWDAYYNRVAVNLKRHHGTVNQARAARAEASQ